MISEIQTPSAAEIAPASATPEQRALARGYQFSAEPTGRVQLISPRGEPCGNFPNREAAALSVAMVEVVTP